MAEGVRPAAGIDPAFWRSRRVLLTGHTGFKGGWAALWLQRLGAEVTGLALEPETEPSLFALAGSAGVARSYICDIRDADALARVVSEAAPEIVIHMAAQPLVLRSYRAPLETWQTNTIGTLNLLEALRNVDGVRAVVAVTTDKVYENSEDGRAFVESDPLGGHDPYAASKAACEIVVASHARAFLDARGTAVGTARGGNVIGGGDFSQDRIVPDVWRAAKAGQPLVLRHPHATRPWQHVLDCLAGYFAFARALAEGGDVPRALNFGPPPDAMAIPVSALATALQRVLGVEPSWDGESAPQLHEMAALAIDSRLARATLGWQDRLAGEVAIAWTADWFAAFDGGRDMYAYTLEQIDRYEALT